VGDRFKLRGRRRRTRNGHHNAYLDGSVCECSPYHLRREFQTILTADRSPRVSFLNLDYMHVVEKLPLALWIRGKTHNYIHEKAIAK
jgi:hypothetical protein